MKCIQNLNIIVLAAGSSRRFGSNKLLHLFHGKPMVQWILDELFNVKDERIQDVIVVTQYEEVLKIANQYGYRTIWNDHSELGISSSIQLGLQVEKADAYMFLTADQPYLKSTTIQAVINTYCNSYHGILSICCGDKLGTPNIFSHQYKNEFMQIKGDIGGKIIIKQHTDDVIYFELGDEKELMDFDTLNDC